MSSISSPKPGKLAIILSILAFFGACLSIVFVFYQQAYIQNELSKLRGESLVTGLMLAREIKQYNSATFDPGASEGYNRINSSSGFFIIILEKVEPYLDGVRVHVRIGNLMFATYKGFKLKAKWGERFDSIDDYNEWKSSLKEKEISFTENLQAGRWNNVNFVLSPVVPKEFGYLELSIETDTVSLSKAFED